MSLIDRVTSWLNRFRQEPPERTTSDKVATPQNPTATSTRFAADRARLDIIRRCRDMYTTDTRAKGVIKALARDMTHGQFIISVPDNPEAETVAQELQARLKLTGRLDDWVRLTLRDGDSFLETSVSEATQGRFQIAEISRKPTLQMHRQSNMLDRFDDPAHAYWLGDTFYWGLEPPKNAIWLADWQIIHARWDHDEGSRYGTPLFGAATAAYKRLSEGERDIATRRKTRAGMRYVHRFPDGTDGTQIERYRELNKTAINDPWAAVADFFGTVDINAVQGDARLGEITDVTHHIRTWWLASPMPMSLLGYGQDLNRDVLDKQKEQYDESLVSLQAWVTDQLVKPLLELEWLLHGMWPGGFAYEVTWKRKQVLKPTDLRDLAEAALRLKALGWRDEAVWAVLEQFLPGVDLAALVGDPTAGNAAPERIAAAVANLRPGR